MQRLASRILIVVVAFVLVVIGLLVARSRALRIESVRAGASNADLEIKEVQLEEDAAGLRWKLNARQALVFEGEGRTWLRRIDVQVLERDRSWAIVGDEGHLDRDKNLEIRGNVVMTSDDGLRLETAVLRWRSDERRLSTDAPVRITRNGAVVEGRALEIDVADEATTIAGPVRAVFQSRSRKAAR